MTKKEVDYNLKKFRRGERGAREKLFIRLPIPHPLAIAVMSRGLLFSFARSTIF